MTKPATRLPTGALRAARTIVLCVGPPALLLGCAAPAKAPPYVVPAGAPTAKLVMRGAVPTGDLFGVFVHEDAQNCQGPRLAGAGNSKRNPNTVPLAAGALTTVDFVLLRANKEACLLRWSFTPLAGKSYLVHGGAFGAGCRASLLDASNPDAMKAPEGIVRRNAAGNACVTMAQAASAAGGNTQGGQDQGAAVLRPGASADDLQGLIGQ